MNDRGLNMASQSITIIIPAYNAAVTLPQCLEAIANSVHHPAEVIVVNDGSTDKTARIAEQFGAIPWTQLILREGEMPNDLNVN